MCSIYCLILLPKTILSFVFVENCKTISVLRYKSNSVLCDIEIENKKKTRRSKMIKVYWGWTKAEISMPV